MALQFEFGTGMLYWYRIQWTLLRNEHCILYIGKPRQSMSSGLQETCKNPRLRTASKHLGNELWQHSRLLTSNQPRQNNIFLYEIHRCFPKQKVSK